MFPIFICFRPLFERSGEDLCHWPLVSVTTSHHQTFVRLYKPRKFNLCAQAMPQTSHCQKMPFPGWGASLQIQLLMLIVKVGMPLLRPSKEAEMLCGLAQPPLK